MATFPVARPLDGDWLERQMFLRGWTLADLETHARIAHGTASAARTGKRLNQDTVRKIAAAFRANPVDPMFEDIAEAIRCVFLMSGSNVFS